MRKLSRDAQSDRLWASWGIADEIRDECRRVAAKLRPGMWSRAAAVAERRARHEAAELKRLIAEQSADMARGNQASWIEHGRILSLDKPRGHGPGRARTLLDYIAAEDPAEPWRWRIRAGGEG